MAIVASRRCHEHLRIKQKRRPAGGGFFIHGALVQSVGCGFPKFNPLGRHAKSGPMRRAWGRASLPAVASIIVLVSAGSDFFACSNKSANVASASLYKSMN